MELFKCKPEICIYLSHFITNFYCLLKYKAYFRVFKINHTTSCLGRGGSSREGFGNTIGGNSKIRVEGIRKLR